MAEKSLTGDKDDTYQRRNDEEGFADRVNTKSMLSDLSTSDSDSDKDATEEHQIVALEHQLQEHPLNYEAHVQYIQLLRKFGHVEKLGQARELMSRYFPLSPNMWQDWAKDVATLKPEFDSFQEIEAIYERGVTEYLSVPLWCDYLEFVQGRDPLVSECAPAGLSKMRTLFERALTAAGLHYSEGNKVWEAYREFEQAIFLTIDENDYEEKTKQAQRIRVLFHRQLSVPLANLKSTLTDCKLWEAEQGNLNDFKSEFDGIPSNVVTAYQKALEMGIVRTSYEEQLANQEATEDHRLQHFMTYIKLEVSFGDPARVQVLYERAVADFAVSSDLWLGYTSYLDKTLKVSKIIKDVYSRATRNVLWIGELWINYMLSLERMCASENELRTVFERAIQCSFPSFKEYLDLFLTRIDGLRRRISLNFSKEDGLEYSVMRETFQCAVDYFSPQALSINDLMRLHEYWAHLEATLAEDCVAARGVWENLIKKSGSSLEVWQGYIAMELKMGHINEARSLYKRCYSKRFQGTGSEDICHSWLRFEREYGTLDDLDFSVKKVAPRLQELMIYKAHQDSQGSLLNQRNDSVTVFASLKRKATKSHGDKLPPAKKRKDNKTKQSKVSVAIPSSTLQGSGDHETNVEDVGVSKSNKTSMLYTDKCTVFISNLNLEANEDHLRKFFRDSGGVTAIRLLRDKLNGKSRGFAYVDFSDEEHLAAAVTKNKYELLGKKLSIARSNPKQGRKKSFGNSTGKENLKGDQKGLVENSEVKTTGNITFAAPRAVVKSLGWSRREIPADEIAEKPKSNAEFREMLLKKATIPDEK